MHKKNEEFEVNLKNK